MAHNFKLTGNVYVSKNGSDANSGLTPDLPKLTVQAGINLLSAGQTLIIGAGVYREAVTRTLNLGVTTGIAIIGDGVVILDGNNNQTNWSITNSANFQLQVSYRNIIFRNYGVVYHYASFNNNGGIMYSYFANCRFITTAINTGNGTAPQSYCGIESCILINSSLTSSFASSTGSAYIFVGKGIFINSLLWGVCTSFINSYIDVDSVIELHSTTAAGSFNFNNLQGKIKMSTGIYAGIPLVFGDHRAYYPTFNVQSFNANPLFNDVQNLNYTLQSGSPHIRAASDYISNIGGTEYAVYKAANSTEFTSGATLTNVTLRGDNSYSITAGTEGRIVTAPISVQWPITKPLTRIEWAGGLEFNKSVTAGTAGNTNVPAYYTETTGAGASPDRLTVLMRYSTQQTQPSLSAEWDNGGYWTAGNWVEVELNTKPKIDANGIGNGDATYIEFSGLGDIAPSWIQLDIKLRNDYNI